MSRLVARSAERLLHHRELPPAIALVVLVLVFQALSGRFLSASQLQGMATLVAAVGITGIGVTFLIIAGEFDLSVGAVFAFIPIILGGLLTTSNWPEPVAFAVVMCIAAGIGAVNGLVTTRFGIPSFITTLGAMFVIKGASVVATGGYNVVYFGEGPVFSLLGGRVGDVPMPLVWAVLLTAALWFVLEHTRYGNWTFAAGSRSGTARALGVPVGRVKVGNFMVSSVCAGFAGCAQFAAYGSVSTGSGQSLELIAIVASVVGGTALFGVTGTVVGTLLGAMVLATLQTGLIVAGAPGAWYTSAIGLILVLTVVANVQIGRLRRIPSSLRDVQTVSRDPSP